jgi:hypothetical protein
MSQQDNTLQQTRMFLENMVGLAVNAKMAGLNLTTEQVVAPTLAKIVEIAEQHFPLARVLDNSDLVLHAEGPGAEKSMPWLTALNWVTGTAESNIRKLATAFFDMKGADGRALARKIDPRLTGIAPGSLWVGIKLDGISEPIMGMPVEADAPTLADELHQLPGLIRFIDDEGMRPGIEEVSPDPAMRDIGLSTLLRFAPTGRRGIHTLELVSRTQGSASLSQRERVVLKQVLDKPRMLASRSGSFVGEVREADLDKTRMHLRGVEGVGTLRCVVPELNAEQARVLLGRRVRVVGSYQVDRNGKPRLMFVERFEEAPAQTSIDPRN